MPTGDVRSRGVTMIYRRWTPSSSGQALVEFALVIPLVLLLLMGLFDFGRAIYAYNTISNAARDGARKAIVDQSEISPNLYVAEREAAQQATALGLNETDETQVHLDVFKPNLAQNCIAETNRVGCVAVVTVRWQFRAITPIIGNFVGPITLSSTTKLPVEYTKP